MKFQVNTNYNSSADYFKILVKNFEPNLNFIYNERNQIKIFDSDLGKIIIKSYKKPFLINAIVYNFFRKPKAKRAYKNSLELQKLNINAPTPYFYALKNTIFTLQQSYFGYEYIVGEVIRKILLDKNYPNRVELLEKFTLFTYNLHQKGIWFKDHSPGNTLFQIKHNTTIFYLIDINRISFNQKFDLNKRLKNFTSLSADLEDLKIIGKKYAQLLGASETEIISKIIQFSEEGKRKRNKKQKIKRFLKLK